ncbi:MAG: hypothetical protein U0169_05125 [Polyangiaceae bacterium]
MSRIRGWKDLVQDGVDVVSRTVEKTHRNIAKRPFDVLEAIPGVDVPTKGVRMVHDAVLTGVYGSIRLVNRLVGGAADVVIDAVASESESESGTEAGAPRSDSSGASRPDASADGSRDPDARG